MLLFSLYTKMAEIAMLYFIVEPLKKLQRCVGF